MATCSLCGKEDLCYTCPYCNGVFCAEHRLPESHGCPSLHLVRDHARQKIMESFSPIPMTEEYGMDTGNQRPRRRRSAPGRKRFSSTEIRHLLISTVLVILVSISLMGGSPFGFINGFFVIATMISYGLWWFPVSVITMFIASFMIHEFSHKFMAQHYGLWSEFRMTTQGYYLSAIAILFSFPVFGTGVMYSSGTRSTSEDGKINLAGPLSNSIIASFCAGIALLLLSTGGINPFLGFVFVYAIQLNAILGLFNMIPIQPFDGATVLHWNKIVWIIVTVLLVVMLLFGYFVLPILIGLP
ncbi:MAG: AN1-type zinc finger domain-containing protein [Candidatus Thorarchaeota archaeon]